MGWGTSAVGVGVAVLTMSCAAPAPSAALFHNRGVALEDGDAVRAEQARCKATLVGDHGHDGCIYVAVDRVWTREIPIRQLQVALDGGLWVRMDALEADGRVGETRSWSLPVAALPAGEHELAVRIYTWPAPGIEPKALEAFTFELRSSHRFVVGPGGGKTVRVVARTKPARLIEDSLGLRFDDSTF